MYIIFPKKLVQNKSIWKEVFYNRYTNCQITKFNSIIRFCFLL